MGIAGPDYNARKQRHGGVGMVESNWSIGLSTTAEGPGLLTGQSLMKRFGEAQ